jgi:hypothetical protein
MVYFLSFVKTSDEQNKIKKISHESKRGSTREVKMGGRKDRGRREDKKE